MHKMIPVAGPSITEKEVNYVIDAIANGWYENANNYIEKFENAFKVYVGRKHAISLPSCTSGLHLSLLSLGVGYGDEVIVPDVTWIASVAPVSYVGAIPIFADIDPKTWCLSAKTVKSLITKKTKAIIAVNLYGHMPEYDELLAFGIPVIEDAAESIGSMYKKKLAGTFGITSCFSFHGSKTLTTGEGGMIVTDDDCIYERCMIMRDHGRLPGDILFQNIEVGYKYKMSNIQAALGLAQLERIEILLQKKKDIFLMYKEHLTKNKYITLNPEHLDVDNSYWMTTVVFDDYVRLHKFDIIRKLNNRRINARPFFSPLSSLKAYQSSIDCVRAKSENVHSYSISARGVNLPSALCITDRDIEKVAIALIDIVNEKS